MRDHLIITDKEVADSLQLPLENIRKAMSILSKNQRKKNWLIISLNKRYIFLNELGVKNFKQLYNQGYNEKKILENLQQKMKIKTRAEVKAIETALDNNDRLDLN